MHVMLIVIPVDLREYLLHTFMITIAIVLVTFAWLKELLLVTSMTMLVTTIVTAVVNAEL
jgi:hypothetical protein